MRFREILRYEVAHQLRRPSTWACLALLLALPLLMVAGGADPVGTGSRFDAPVKIAVLTLFVGLLGTLVTAGLFVEAGHRDVRWRMDRLFYTAPVRKREYLGGRFLGALLINALLLLAVPTGLLLSRGLPGVDPGTVGPMRAGSYLLPYLAFLLPNLLVTAAVLFGVTVLSRRSLPGYLGGLGLLAAYLVAVNATAGLDPSPLLALLDPTGAVALTGMTRGWTPVELDARPVELRGTLLWNRLLWAGLGAGTLAWTCRRFRLAHAGPGTRRRRGRKPEASPPARPARVVAARGGAREVPSAPRAFGIRARAAQTLAIARIGLRQTVLGREIYLVVPGLFLLVLLMGNEALPLSGAPISPRTQEVIPVLTGDFIQLVVALLTAFYAGELVWQDRDAGMEKIGDSAPVPDWGPLAGCFLALGLMLVALQAVLMAAGMTLQALHGYAAFQPGLYVRVLFGLQLADHLLFAAVALSVHVLVNQKYVGHLIAPLLYLLIGFAGRLGIEHNLLVYGSDAGWVYSDLNGFGPYVAPFVWFKLYWAGWAALLGVVAMVSWVRGTEAGPAARLRRARRRFTPRVAAGAGAAVLLVLSTGGFVFYNTNVLNDYRTAREADAIHAEYERRYKRFEHVPQPWLTGTTLEVEIHPERREAAVRGTYRLVNRTEAPIDSVHLSFFPDAAVTARRVRFDRPSEPALEDARHGYRVHVLERALQPGDSLRMHFAVDVGPRGFRNRERVSANATMVGDFTQILSRLVLPALGYQRDLMELSSPEARREHGLPAVDAAPGIDDPRARRLPRSSPEADWIAFEATVGTARGHVAVAPGTLQRSWTEGGRSYFHYRAESPILNGFALLSAEWAVHEARWNDVGIRVLHHPDHDVDVDRMVRDVAASLEYFTGQFGPYPHRRFWMLEVPRYGTYARAFPGMMVYSENHPISTARPGDAPVDGIDMPLLVTAHETAHQWWGHQVMGADVQGSQVLSETLAQYSAVMVLERSRGPRAARRFLRSMQLSYLDGRGRHPTPEVPLLLTTDHEHVHYRKGAVVMYALQDHVGEDRINAALRRLVERHGMRGPPYPTTLDLYDELRAVTPDSLRPLLDDLVASITLWDLRATGARAVPAGNGEYRVTLEIEATKLRSDSVGNDTEVPMDDPVEIGVFADGEGGERLGEPLYLAKHRLRSGRQTITVTVPGRPSRAAVDPHHTLIARRLEALIVPYPKETEVTIDDGPGAALPVPE